MLCSAYTQGTLLNRCRLHKTKKKHGLHVGHKYVVPPYVPASSSPTLTSALQHKEATHQADHDPHLCGPKWIEGKVADDGCVHSLAQYRVVHVIVEVLRQRSALQSASARAPGAWRLEKGESKPISSRAVHPKATARGHKHALTDTHNSNFFSPRRPLARLVSLPLSLPPSLPPFLSLTPSLPPSRPPSFPPSLLPSLSPSLSSNLSLARSFSLTRSLARALSLS